MRFGRSRFTFTTSVLLALAAAPVLADECPALRSEATPMHLDGLLALGGRPYGSPNSDSNINNAGMDEEDFGDTVRLRLWRRERSGVPLPEVRFGPAEVGAQVVKPDGVLVAPISLWSCFIAAGDQAYLSDGITDHSAMVFAVDRGAKVVTFVDARAAEVFLLSSNALFDDFGGQSFERDGRSFFTVPFASMDKLLKQLVLASNYNIGEVRAAIETILPEVPPLELLYWRDQSAFATTDYDAAPDRILDFMTPKTGESLQQVLVNYLFLETDLVQKVRGQLPALATEYQLIVPELPQHVSANMLFRAALDLLDANEPALASAISEAYIAAHGPDVDFSLLLLMAARATGDTAASDQLANEIRSALDARLARMYRGEGPDENRRMLAGTAYENTSILLMRERFRVLEGR